MTLATKKMIPLLQTGAPSTMVSSRPGLSLRPTEFSLLENVRNRYGVVEVRKSDESWALTGLPADPVIYGAYTTEISGVSYVLLAVKNGDAVDIYDSADGHAFTRRSGVTGSSGIYPNSSLSLSAVVANGVVFESVVTQRLSLGLGGGAVTLLTFGVIISDGAKVFMWTASGVAPVEPFDNTYSLSEQSKATGRYNSAFLDADLTKISGTVTGTTFTYTETAGLSPFVSIAGTQADGDTFEVSCSAPTVGGTTGDTLFMLVATDHTTCDIFAQCKLEVGGVTIYDPTVAGSAGPSVEIFWDDNIGKPMLIFAWTSLVALSGGSDPFKFTYKGATDRYEATQYDILAFGRSGTGPVGVPNYALAYASTVHGAESGLTVLDSSKATGPTITYKKASGTVTIQAPLSTNVRLNWRVFPALLAPASYYNRMNLYRKDPGSSKYLAVAFLGISTWSGSAWVASAASPIIDVWDESQANPDYPAPTAFNTAPTAFTSAINANNRLFIGKTSEYWFSEYRFPMRHAQVVDPDAFDRTPGGFKFSGETPKAFTHLVGDANLDRVALMTDKASYSLSGLDSYSLMRPGRIGQYGTLSGKSVVTRRGTTFFLDDARHLRINSHEGGLEQQSFAVKDRLDQIPFSRIDKVIGGVHDDRYYMFYTPEGETKNTKAFVYDLLSNSLTHDSYGSEGVVATFSYEGKFVAIMTDGTARQLEVGTADVTINIVTREIGTDGESWQAGRQRLYCDDADATLDMHWTAYRSGASVTSPLNLSSDGSDARTDRYTALGKSIRGRSVKFGLSGPVPGGTRFFEWNVEQEGRVSEGDA